MLNYSPPVFSNHLINPQALGKILTKNSYNLPLDRKIGDDYLYNILARENSNTNHAEQIASNIRPIIKKWSGEYFKEIYLSGSLAKGTANKSSNDIDLLISLKANPIPLKKIYNSLFLYMQGAGYYPKKQNVSINITVNGYDVDLVPARMQDSISQNHSLYCRKKDEYIKTNVHKHIELVRNSGYTNEIRIVKLWRDQNKVDLPSFYLEMIVMSALKDSNTRISDNILKVFKYIKDNFYNTRVIDPANTNNIISDNLTADEKIIELLRKFAF